MFENFAVKLPFAKIFSVNILLHYIALCLYIESEVTHTIFPRENSNFKTFRKIFCRKHFSLYSAMYYTHACMHVHTHKHTWAV